MTNSPEFRLIGLSHLLFLQLPQPRSHHHCYIITGKSRNNAIINQFHLSPTLTTLFLRICIPPPLFQVTAFHDVLYSEFYLNFSPPSQPENRNIFRFTIVTTSSIIHVTILYISHILFNADIDDMLPALLIASLKNHI
jgi:hypothetical protein